jgi:hypothetical protein
MTTAAGESAAPRPRYYLLEHYYLRNGSQMARMHQFLAQGWLPAVRFLAGPKIILEALVAPHMPQVTTVTGIESLADWEAARSRLNEDASYRKMLAAWEQGTDSPYEHSQQILLRAAPYSPAVASIPVKAPRIFELRVYHSPTWRQLSALHDRFAGPEIKIFHRVGVHPILYTETAIGPHMPNLTYLIPFEDLAAREKAWTAFAADAEWVKVRKESIDAHGQISAYMQISLFRAAPYSPVL